jgi:hypothetical protein
MIHQNIKGKGGSMSSETITTHLSNGKVDTTQRKNKGRSLLLVTNLNGEAGICGQSSLNGHGRGSVHGRKGSGPWLGPHEGDRYRPLVERARKANNPQSVC